MELPKEIEWNIIKYMSHPVADLLKQHRVFQQYQFCERYPYLEDEDEHESFSACYFEAWYEDHNCDRCCNPWSYCECCCSNCGGEYVSCKGAWCDHERIKY